MRVISGSAKGLNLSSPEGLATRPTLGRVKEALFNMLAPYLKDAVVLDLFAGSGALGIESLSRGAGKAYFIDNSALALDCVERNINKAKFSSLSTVINSDAEKFLNKSDEKFDIIFIDPPYSHGLYDSILSLIEKKKCLKEDGVIILEWDYEIGFVNRVRSFEVFRQKKYGRVGLTVLKWGVTQ